MNANTKQMGVVVLLALAVVLGASGCLARSMDTIPDTLLGTWHGDSRNNVSRQYE